MLIFSYLQFKVKINPNFSQILKMKIIIVFSYLH